MRAIYYDGFSQRPILAELPDPVPSERGVVVRVETTGLCRSDIHGWLGHDGGITLPHVPGHELVGTIESIGAQVHRFTVGQRVTVPFVCACGHCPECAAGLGNICRNQTQPGFTHWGSYAELVALHDADNNLIPVPHSLDGGAAALLGCRFATAYRGLAHHAELESGEVTVIIGCGGVGLSAVMIALAIGARVVAVDISRDALDRARALGAQHTIDSSGLSQDDVLAAIRDLAPNGAEVSVEALGRAETIQLAIRSLGAGGRHVQIGLTVSDPVIPMAEVIARELTVHGSHGMPAADYAGLLELVESGALHPEALIERRIRLDEVPDAMLAMAGGLSPGGVTVIDIGAGDGRSAE